MHSKTEIFAKLDSLLAYSQATDPDHASEFVPFINSFKSAVTAYFEADRNSWAETVRDYRYCMFSDLLARGSTIETPHDLGLRTDYPTGYTDVRDLFYTFPVMSCTDAQFFNAWVMGVPDTAEDETTEPTPIVISNSLLTEWTTDLVNEPLNEYERLKALVTWLDSSLSTQEGVTFWEKDYTVKESPPTGLIAHELFIERGFKEVIQTFGLTEYIPSYV